MTQLIRACGISEIEEEDVIRFDHGDRTFAIYHGPNGDFYATDGYCTHEKAHLGDGLVDDYEIECPLHFGAYGGLPLKILWAILDVFTIVVLGSGLYLWWVRRRGNSKATSAAVTEPSA